MNLELGFWRLTLVLSFVAITLGIALDLALGNTHFGVIAGVVLAGAFWLLFYVIRWVARGFSAKGGGNG
jgi:hypothetical protein